VRVHGKVVGNVVVLEQAIPEVEVLTADERGVFVEQAADEELAATRCEGVPLPEETRVEDSDGWDLSDEEWADMDESITEADRGELVPAESVLTELRSLSSERAPSE
jgi:hypothetical protein